MQVEITAKSFFAIMEKLSQPVTFLTKQVERNLSIMEIKGEGSAPALTVINSLMNDGTVVTTYYLEVAIGEAPDHGGSATEAERSAFFFQQANSES